MYYEINNNNIENTDHITQITCDTMGYYVRLITDSVIKLTMMEGLKLVLFLQQHTSYGSHRDVPIRGKNV